jgi:hypothetical protein
MSKKAQCEELSKFAEARGVTRSTMIARFIADALAMAAQGKWTDERLAEVGIGRVVP